MEKTNNRKKVVITAAFQTLWANNGKDTKITKIEDVFKEVEDVTTEEEYDAFMILVKVMYERNSNLIFKTSSDMFDMILEGKIKSSLTGYDISVGDIVTFKEVRFHQLSGRTIEVTVTKVTSSITESKVSPKNIYTYYWD